MTYRLILSFVLVLLVIWIGISARKRNGFFQSLRDFLLQQFRVIYSPFRNKDTSSGYRISGYKSSVLGLTGWLFVILAATSFLPVLIAGSPLSGWMLILHVTVAPFFVLSLAATALLFAVKKQFGKSDHTYLQSLRSAAKNPESQPFISKVSFWAFMVVAIPAILSVILSMYPLFTAEGLEVLVTVHRYATLLLFGIVAIYGMNRITK